mmetsp:Transcript_32411/g.69011  ORF Transcript_32411/g.69011 Transcript_32411/m.69011 type:complete len:294 (-) Transcript_32411:647-1528(-)
MHPRQVVAAQRPQPEDVRPGLEEELILRRRPRRERLSVVEVTRRATPRDGRHGARVLQQRVVEVRHLLEVLQRHSPPFVPPDDAVGQCLVPPHDQPQLLVLAVSYDVRQLELIGVHGRSRFEGGELFQLLIGQGGGVVVSVEEGHEFCVASASAFVVAVAILGLLPIPLQVLDLQHSHPQLLCLHRDGIFAEDDLGHGRRAGGLTLKRLGFERVEFRLEGVVRRVRNGRGGSEEGYFFRGRHSFFLQLVVAISQQRSYHVLRPRREEIEEFQLPHGITAVGAPAVARQSFAEG